jgi:hypothetical protein
MMSLVSRRELLAAVSPRYHRSTKKEKHSILREFIQNTGYHPKYALILLNHPPAAKRPTKRRRPRKYPASLRETLVQLWRCANGICGKRLVPFLPELIRVLERHHEIAITPEAKALLLQMSPATCDRLLRHERQTNPKPRGLSTTKPGTLLKNQIPVRVFTAWDEAVPGFLEVDLVAHCGRAVSGEYLHTLVLTDIKTTWTECVALLNRSQKTVSAAIAQVRTVLPFSLLGLDSDNGPEFINANLLRYCTQEHVTFTRSRPYKKNDQAHVEQKNWTHVRHFTGYERYEGPRALKVLANLYKSLVLYMNYFQPTLKLVSKQRIDGHVRKQYDTAQTPYRRVLACPEISEDYKEAARLCYETLNPFTLLAQMKRFQQQLWVLETVRSPIEATLPSE